MATSPFPGMDPYLERPALWPDVHSRLIVLLADDLAPRLRPHYYVSVEERTYLARADEWIVAGRADVGVVERQLPRQSAPALPSAGMPQAVIVELPQPVEMRERYLEVRTVHEERIVTVVEVLSPSNKRPGEGREQYLRKREAVLGTLTHLVEIDLLRGGEPMPMLGAQPSTDYRILISRSEARPQAILLPFLLRQPAPTFLLPLLASDAEPEVELNRLLHELYDRAGYDLRVDYRQQPTPPLIEADVEWADELLIQAGLR